MAAAASDPARQRSLREHNLALALTHLADHGPASRAHLAAATGLTKATVSSLVETLMDGDLVAELGPARPTAAGPDARVGRPGSQLALSPTGPVGIGLEINVDYLATCTVDLRGTVRHRQLIAEDFRRGRVTRALDRAASALRAAIAEARAAGSSVAGVAVAVPGLVETGRQVLRLAPNLGWRDVAVLDELGSRLAEVVMPPATVDNEANLAALAELWCGGHRGGDGGPLRTFVHISGEIGVGAGLIVDGRLFRGLRGFSGEIGHLPVGPGGAGAACSCGSTGCLEQLAGQEAILQAAGVASGLGAAGQASDRRAGTATGAPDGPVEALVRAAQRSDPAALAAIAQAGTALGTGIAGVLNLVDSDTVVLGGLYARLAPWLTPAVDAEIARRTVCAAWAPVRILVSPLGAEAAVRGAAMSVVRGVIADPAGHLAGQVARPVRS